MYGAFGRDFATLDGKRLMVVGLAAMQWRCLVNATGMHDAVAALGTRLGLDFEDEGNRYSAVLCGRPRNWDNTPTNPA